MISRMNVYAVFTEIVLFSLMCLEYNRQGGPHGGGPYLGVLMLTQLPGILVAILLSFFFTGPGRSPVLEGMADAVIITTIFVVQLLLALGIAWAVRRTLERRQRGS
jgi:hypothetical protein